MRIAIFNHPYYDFYSTPNRIYSGLLNYLGDTLLPEHEYRCYNVLTTKRTVSLPVELNYLKKYTTEDLSHYSFFHRYFHFREADNFDLDNLKKFSPQAILVNSFAYAYFDGFKEQTDYLKRLFPDVPLICGGQGPSSYPEYYIKNSRVDYVVKGPAELSLNILLDRIHKNEKISIDNVSGKNLITQENLNREYEFKPFADIQGSTVHLHLTRGCPKKCTYCSVNIATGNLFLKSSIEEIENTISRLPSSIRYFDIEDDNLSSDKCYFKDIVCTIKKYFPDSEIGFENGIDFTTLDDELIQFLVDHKIRKWNLSLVSVSKEILSNSKRGYYLETFDRVIDEINRHSPPATVYFISGLRHDTIENVLASLFYLAGKNVVIGFSPFYPVPSTIDAENLTIKSPVLAKGTSFYGWHSITTDEQISIFMLSRFINAVKRYSTKEWREKTKNLPQIANGKISGSFNRDDATLSGILYSLKNRCIAGVNRKGEFFRFPMNDNVLSQFLAAYDKGLEIRLKDGVFDRELFDKIN